MQSQHRHKRSIAGYWLFALLGATLCATPQMAQAGPKAESATRVTATILPQRFVRQYDPITVVYSAAVGPQKSRVEANGAKWLRIEPKRNGTYRWVDAKTLEFRPAQPWPAYARVKATVTAKATATHTLYTLLPGPTSVSPARGAQDQRAVKRISLVFGQIVPKSALRKAIQLRLLTLPGVGNNMGRMLDQSQWWLKQVASPQRRNTRYAIMFRHPLPNATTVQLMLRLSLPATGKQSKLQQPVWSSHFRTMHPFYLTGVQCAKHTTHLSWGKSRTPRARALDCGGNAAVPTLIFSRPISPKTNPGLLRRLIRVSPMVAGLKLAISGRYVRIQGQYRRDSLYRLTIEGGQLPIVDNAGQRLQHSGRQTLFFFLGQKRPFLRWRVGQGLLERHGPQMMPLQARSIGRVDMRIHPLKANDRRFWPFPSKALQVNESTAPPQAGTQPKTPLTHPAAPNTGLCRGRRCTGNAYWKQYLLPHIKQLGTPLFSGIVHLPSDPQGRSHNVGLNLRNQLKSMLPWNPAKAGITLPKSNQFLVGVRLLNGSTKRGYVRVQVTDLALTTVEERDAIQFAVTSLKTAQAVAGAEVIIEGPTHRLARQWSVLWRGTTNAKGLVKLPLSAKRKGFPSRIRVRKGNDQLLLNPKQPPPVFVNRHWSPSHKSWLSWTQHNVTKPIAPSVQAHVFTERPVYRPGEPVHIKGIIRTRIAGKLALPTKKDALSIRLDISGPKQQRWIFDDVKISKSGSVYRKFLPNNPPKGAYLAKLLWMRNDGRSLQLATRRFKIEEYKLPLFEVLIHAPRKVPADKPFHISSTARYYAGGLLISQPIKWRVTERVIRYRPKGRKGYVFSSNIRYSRHRRNRRKLLVQKSDKISPQGQAKLRLDPTKSFDMRARSYAVEAVVKGPDGRDVAGYKQIKVLPPFSVGVKINNRFQLKPGPIAADFIAVGVKGALRKGVPLTVQLLRREWHAQLVETDFVKGRTRYRTEVVDRPVKKCKVKTGSRAVRCPLTANKAGVYVLQIDARDKMGRLQRVSIDMYVQGKQAIAWERSRNSTFQLSLSKSKYRVGETARVLVRSPYQQAKGLAIIEDSSGTRYKWLNIDKGKGLLEIPIAKRHTPSLQVHVVLMRGRVAMPLKRGLDPGKPKTAVASASIPVDPRANRIMLAMKWPKQARPRQWVEGTISMKTPDGKPLSGEVTLWAVDRAALSLGYEERIHPLKSFVLKRASAIRIRDTRNLVIGRLAKLADRSGGGGGGRGGMRFMVRKRFKTVPYYNPAIQVGPSGTVKVRFQLPDDLTTFAIRAVGASGPARFGYIEKHLLVQLPVMVQRALPRFVRPGDQMLSGGFARIVAGKAGPAIAKVFAKGMQILGASTRRFSLRKRGAVQVFFNLFTPLKARRNVSVQMRVRRLKDNERDAFEVKLPVKPDRRRVYILREQYVSSLDKVISLPTKWPEAIRAGSGKVEVLLASSDAIIRTVGAMEYLLKYPYGCVEQRVSRGHPMLVLESIHRQFAMRHLSSGRTQRAVRSTLEHIKGTIQRDGSIGYWPGSQRSVWLTAYAMAFVLEAKKSGYAYPQKLLERSLKALRRSLRSDIGLGQNQWQLATRAEVLWTLARAGQHQPAYLRRLYRQRQQLDLYGRTRLLLAMHRDNARHLNRINALRRDLLSRVGLNSTRQLKRISFVRTGFWYGVLLSSRTRTMAAMLEALAAVAPKSKQVKAIKDALLSRFSHKRLGYGWRNDGLGWGNTQNNAQALLALRSFLHQQTKANKPQYFAYRIQRQGQRGWSPSVRLTGKSAWHFVTRSDVPLKLQLSAARSKQPVWIRARYSYIPKPVGATLKALNRGIAVQRNTRVVTGKASKDRFIAIKAGKPIRVKRGQLLEEEVRIIVSKQRYHVVVEVPFAAGMTLLNPKLKTTSALDAKPSQANTLRASHTEYLDDRVRYFFDQMPAGIHKLYFRARAVTAGRYTYPAATARLMYQPSIFGRSPGHSLQIAAPRK